MSHDSTTPDTDLSLGEHAIIAAATKLLGEHIAPVLSAKTDAPRALLLDAYDSPDATKSVDAKVDGVAVGTYTVALTRPKFQIGDMGAFEALATEHGEMEIIVRVRPAFVEAMLKAAAWDKSTGTVVHKQTGEILPGITYVPGGTPKGVTFSWKTDGKDTLYEAIQAGKLNRLLRDVPMLPAPTGE
ncbi:hypothetical protein G3I60_05425 [Streptomyces sp. SID13666]|uniref:hypothetical protein n=1 Tax=Streptomyces sp. SID13666 TaxID=2706054 RepID=UPI0013BFDC69|nr:hypothetical protein [Streptomyces sp. SID13666]NEA53612.1 hypothetical protein [Streptomyces sp. SID13666]